MTVTITQRLPDARRTGPNSVAVVIGERTVTVRVRNMRDARGAPVGALIFYSPANSMWLVLL